MSILGLSLFAHNTEYPAPSPQDGPLRPGAVNLLMGCFVRLFIPFFLLAFVLNFHPIFGLIGYLGMLAAFITPFVQWRRYEHIGWYKHREVVTPKLPYEMRAPGEKIVFGTETMTFSGFLKRKRTLSYTQILKVDLNCEGECLKGVVLGLTRNDYWSDKNAPQNISDDGDGERTRTVMAILREKAPHATLSGSRWVEEGWVPRLGFSHPDYGGGGGG